MEVEIELPRSPAMRPTLTIRPPIRVARDRLTGGKAGTHRAIADLAAFDASADLHDLPCEFETQREPRSTEAAVHGSASSPAPAREPGTGRGTSCSTGPSGLERIARMVPPTRHISRMGWDPSQSMDDCLTCSKNTPFGPLMSDSSMTVPGCRCVSK